MVQISVNLEVNQRTYRLTTALYAAQRMIPR
jgi:hypothetical protein